MSMTDQHSKSEQLTAEIAELEGNYQRRVEDAKRNGWWTSEQGIALFKNYLEGRREIEKRYFSGTPTL